MSTDATTTEARRATRPTWRWVLTALCVVGLALSSYLSWHTLRGGAMIGCGGGSPCDEVLNSRWSSLAGVLPVSGLAASAYLAMLVCSLSIGPGNPAPVRRLAWRALLVLAGAAAGSAVWFIVVQKWIVGAWCPYCLATHLTSLLVAALVVAGLADPVRPAVARLADRGRPHQAHPHALRAKLETRIPNSESSPEPQAKPVTQPATCNVQIRNVRPSNLRAPSWVARLRATLRASSQPTSDAPTLRTSDLPDLRPSEPPAFRPSGPPAFRPSGPPALRPSEPPAFRPSGPPVLRTPAPPFDRSTVRPSLPPFLAGVALAALLVVAQIGLAPPATFRAGEAQAASAAIDPHAVPLVGSPDARYVVTLLFDYKCPHCQQLHLMLGEATRRYRGQLAFALSPAPLNRACNPYVPRDVDEFKDSCELTRIALAVWLADRAAFPAFDDWMFSFDTGDRWHPRTLDAARAKAIELVGRAKFDAAAHDPWIDRYLQTSVRLYGETMQNGQGGVPKLVFGSHWVNPQPNTPADLVSILETGLGLPPP